MNKCAIYARYSSHNQNDASIEQQVAECKKYATQQGLEVVKVYADRAISGWKPNARPEFDKMVRDSANGNWDTLIVWKTDRFGRNRYEIASSKYRLKKNGITFLTCKEFIPPGPEGILMESILEGSAEYYSANLSQNVKRGLRANAEQGIWNSCVPYGYRRGKDGKLELEETESPLVQEMFDGFANGRPVLDMATEFNERGLRTRRGSLWSHTSINNILKNEVYTGTYRNTDIRIENAFPAIVDSSTFARAKARIDQRKDKTTKPRMRKHEYILSGRIICGLCGSPMIGSCSKNKTTGERYYYYICSKSAHRLGCKKRSIRAEWLETNIADLVTAYVLNEQSMEWIADEVMLLQASVRNSDLLARLKRELSETETARRNVMAAIEAGIFTPSTKNRLQELEQRAQELQAAIEKESASDPEIERDMILFWLQSMASLELQDLQARRQFMDSMVARVDLQEDSITIWIHCTGGGGFIACAWQHGPRPPERPGPGNGPGPAVSRAEILVNDNKPGLFSVNQNTGGVTVELLPGPMVRITAPFTHRKPPQSSRNAT